MKCRIVLCTQIHSRKYTPVEYFSANIVEIKTASSHCRFPFERCQEIFQFFKLHCPLGERIFSCGSISMPREQKPSCLFSFSFEGWTLCFLRMLRWCLLWVRHDYHKDERGRSIAMFCLNFYSLTCSICVCDASPEAWACVSSESCPVELTLPLSGLGTWTQERKWLSGLFCWRFNLA